MQKFVAKGNPKTQPRKWLRASFIDEDGTLYLPCAMFGSERAAFLCIAFDGVPVRLDKNHVYAPVWWLMQEYPKHKEEIQIIRDKILAAMEKATDTATCHCCQ